jgi:hypothetical protein
VTTEHGPPIRIVPRIASTLADVLIALAFPLPLRWHHARLLED